MLSTTASAHLAHLPGSTRAEASWRFGRALQALGGVGLDGPVASQQQAPEECLVEAQVEIFESGGTLERAEVWLRTALDRLLGSDEDEAEQRYLLVWQARLTGLLWVARGRADHSLRVIVAGQFNQGITRLNAFPSGQAAGLGAAMLQPAGEIARWRLRTFHDIDVEEARALLAAASPGGLQALPGPQELEELVALHLPAVGQSLGDRPLDDGLAEVQAAAYVGTARDGLAVRSRDELTLPEMLELRRPEAGHQWLLERELAGGAAGRGGHLREADVGASMALLEELEEVVTTL